MKAESIKCTFTTKGTLKLYSTETVEEAKTQMQQESIKGGVIKPEILGSGLGSTSGQMVAGDSGKFEVNNVVFMQNQSRLNTNPLNY